ncbi:MAG: radical SAM protein [Candidatus Thermoplasmatota archaeon]|nr:radical SAM protein [Candidatus Thermoplasmatota archaeon]
MKILTEYGRDELAKVYVMQLRDEKASENDKRFLVECVESIQPPLTRKKKWVLIVSSMFGCPVQCKMCDAGGDFFGCLTSDEIFSQIEYMVQQRFQDDKPRTAKFKIQFARMGEPTLNPAVLDVLEQLPTKYDQETLHISVSSIAPRTAAVQRFFDELCEIKNRYYSHGRFQLQFSLHTTDEAKRDELIPIKKWSFEEIAAFGRNFYQPQNGDKKITLNFAPIQGYPIDFDRLSKVFSPDCFLIKLTPVNPTVRSQEGGLQSTIDPNNPQSAEELVKKFKEKGYEVILSIGVLEENQIGSNCGQFIQRAQQTKKRPQKSYELERYVSEYSKN